MMRFRRTEVNDVFVVRWLGDNVDDVRKILKKRKFTIHTEESKNKKSNYAPMTIETSIGESKINVGDYIIWDPFVDILFTEESEDFDDRYELEEY